jgi:hypothetical protein
MLGRISAAAQTEEQLARASAVIQTYDAQGVHRTATDVDNRSGQWLAEQAERAGAEAKLESFSLGRVDVRAAFVEAEGRRAEGVPFFDGGASDPQGVSGRIGPPEHNFPIALVVIDAPGISSEGRSLDALRRSTAHRGIVAVTQGAHPGLSLSNAGQFASPYGLPVLQVSDDDHLWLRDLTARGLPVRFVVDARRTPSQAANVVATVRGGRPDLPPVVVMTPRSGWFHCASERGGGLACWLEAIRAAAAAKPARTLVAVASSGHELGHYGLDAFLDARPALVKTAAAWIHLGANIGAAGGAPRLQASDDEIEALAGEALTKAGATVRQRVPRGTRPGGEARNIHDGGGRYVSMLGSGRYFHNIADRWPVSVDIGAVARFSAAFASLAVRLTAA